MKVKLRNFISISSLSSLLLMPLVAASCKKNDNGNNNKVISEGSNSKRMTPQFI
ncbi:variable surface lipoprotein [Mycoplasmopsis agalactiae]